MVGIVLSQVCLCKCNCTASATAEDGETGDSEKLGIFRKVEGGRNRRFAQSRVSVTVSDRHGGLVVKASAS